MSETPGAAYSYHACLSDPVIREKAYDLLMLLTVLDLLALTLSKALSTLIRVLPERYGEAVAWLLVKLLIAVGRRFKQVGLRNLEIAFPELSEERRRLILARSFRVLARNLLGFSRIPTLTRQSALGCVEPENLTGILSLVNSARMSANGTGLLLATSHFGNYETLSQLYALFFRPVSILARGFGLPRTDRWWHKHRGLFGNQIFGRLGGYREMVERLKRGEDVMVLSDQNVKANHAVFVDFLGIKAATTKSVALAALRTGAPVLFLAGVEVSPNRYFLTGERICEAGVKFADADAAVQEITQKIAHALERLIRENPESWFWIHRRFKTRPPGEPETLYL